MKWLRFGDQGLEVERWQAFLCGFFPSARAMLVVDGDFGPTTLKFTQQFQVRADVPADGVVGNQTLGIAARYGFPLIADNDVDQSGPNWPAIPAGVRQLTDGERADMFGTFTYQANGNDQNPESIRITDGWVASNIVSVKLSQLARVSNVPRDLTVKVHAKIENQFVALWETWEREGLLKHVLTWNGSFVPRFIRGSRTRLSNHSWGTAFDINVQWNPLGHQGALKGETGSVRELVESACEHGMFWGNWFKNRPDAMHFEAYKLV